MSKGPLFPLNEGQRLLKEQDHREAKKWEVGWTVHSSQKAKLLGRKTSEPTFTPLSGVQETDGQADRQSPLQLESATARQPHS